MLQQLAKLLLESALDGKIAEHLGYDKHDPAGRSTGRSRIGARSRPCCRMRALSRRPCHVAARGGRGPKTVAKRQRPLSDVDAMVISLYAKGLTIGKV